jgi:putative membrane protein
LIFRPWLDKSAMIFNLRVWTREYINRPGVIKSQLHYESPGASGKRASRFPFRNATLTSNRRLQTECFSQAPSKAGLRKSLQETASDDMEPVHVHEIHTKSTKRERPEFFMIRNYLVLIIKGMGMGAANVIPGVSGGTIALIAGIFQRLIDSIKSFNLRAVKFVFQGRWKDFVAHTDFYFLLSVFLGAGISILSLARLLRLAFDHYPVFIWSYFFGLILASVFFVGKTINRWRFSVILAFAAGSGIAAAISLLSPAAPNDSFFYLVICGVVAICSMILPGLSGSFVLILMGNYELVVIDAVSTLNFRILFPVAIGAVAGLIAFSHFLSWIFKKFRDETLATLTGFILGSLVILWPWKTAIPRLDAAGNALYRNGKALIEGYSLFIPPPDVQALWAVLIMLAGMATIWITEKLAAAKN